MNRNRAKIAKSADWKCNHISIASQSLNTSSFLRKVAEIVEEIGQADILSIDLARYWTRDADNENELAQEWNATVFYVPSPLEN